LKSVDGTGSSKGRTNEGREISSTRIRKSISKSGRGNKTKETYDEEKEGDPGLLEVTIESEIKFGGTKVTTTGVAIERENSIDQNIW